MSEQLQAANNDDFQPLLKLASEILQDMVRLAGKATLGSDRLTHYSESAAGKMIRLITMLSQASIEQACNIKSFLRQQRKSMRYIEELRDCLIKQNEEIQRLEAINVPTQKETEHQYVHVGVNTDSPMPSLDEVMRKHKDEIDDLESKIKELEVFSYSIIRDNKILRKDLAKANMMLRTQQILLEEYEEDDVPRRSANSRLSSSNSRKRDNFEYEKESTAKNSTIKTDTLSKDDFPGPDISHMKIVNFKRMALTLPNESDIGGSSFQNSTYGDPVTKAVDSLTTLARTMGNSNLTVKDESIISSPLKSIVALSGTINRYQDHYRNGRSTVDDDCEINEDSFESMSNSLDITNEPNIDLSTEHPEYSQLSHGSNESEELSNIGGIIDDVEKKEEDEEDDSSGYVSVDSEEDNSSDQYLNHSMTGTNTKESNDSFALIANYYDDYFRNNNEIYIDGSGGDVEIMDGKSEKET